MTRTSLAPLYADFMRRIQDQQKEHIAIERGLLTRLVGLQQLHDGPEDCCGRRPRAYEVAAAKIGLKALTIGEIADWMRDLDTMEARIPIDYGDTPAARALFDCKVWPSDLPTPPLTTEQQEA